MIADKDITTADPEAIIEQYTPLVKKIANKYENVLSRSGAVGIDDLYQSGFITIIDLQKKYNPSAGSSFMSFVYNPIRWAMQKALGFNPNTGAAPEQLAYLDEPLGTESDDITLGDTIADPNAVAPDDSYIIEETKQETSSEVRAAVDRLKKPEHREVIRHIWLEEKDKETTAGIMGIDAKTVGKHDLAARRKLMQDRKLRTLYYMPTFSTSLAKFKHTQTSAVEMAVMWREETMTKSYCGLEPDRYLELKHMCRQYPLLKKQLCNKNTKEYKRLIRKTSLIERCALSIDNGLWSQALILNICYGQPYELIDREILPSLHRETFFQKRREFFALLDEMREKT